MNEEVIGYLINESSLVEHELRNVKETKKGVVKMVAVLQEANLPNRNKRIYPKDAIQGAIDSAYIKEKLRTNSLLSEQNHPVTTSMDRQMTIDMTNAACVIKKVYWDPNDSNLLLGEVETAGTRVGKDLAGLILENNMQASFSMRGAGNVVKEGGLVRVKAPLRIITWDVVHFPSHEKAYQRQLVENSTMVEVKLDQLKEYVKDVSSNLNQLNESVLGIVKEAMDIDFDKDMNIIVKEKNIAKAKVFTEASLKKEMNSTFLSILR